MASKCRQCSTLLTELDYACSHCGLRINAPFSAAAAAPPASPSAAVESTPEPATPQPRTYTSEPADLDSHRIQVDAIDDDELPPLRITAPTRRREVLRFSAGPSDDPPPQPDANVGALAALSTSTPPRRREIIRVSPLVFFLIPVIFFYGSAVLASYTLHFGSGSSLCTSSLNNFLWGAIILGYLFVLGFAWMVVGPRVDSLPLKWGAILLFTVLLGVLTGMGAAVLIDSNNSTACEESAWYITCWLITGFYIVFWIFLATLVTFEVARALCCPIDARVLILGVGAGFNKLHLKPLSGGGGFFGALADKLPKAKPRPPLVSATTTPNKEEARPKISQRARAELELAALDDPTISSPSAAADIRLDNWTGLETTEKRRSNEKDRALEDDEPKRPGIFTNFKNTSVAPSPVESEEDTPTKRRRKRDERAKAEASAAGDLAQVKLSPAGSDSDEDSPHALNPLTAPTPARKQILPPLQTNKVGHDSDGEDDLIDPFAARIASNKLAQRERRAAIERLHRETLALQQGQGITPPPGPSASPTPVPQPASSPVGILKAPNASRDTFKMVDFPSESRLEEVRPIDPYEDSFPSTVDHSDAAWPPRYP